MFEHRLIHDVTVIPASVSDDNGDTVLTYVAPGVTERAWIEQRTTTEGIGDRVDVVGVFDCVFHAVSTITSTSRVEWLGGVFEVSGEPASRWTLDGVHHIEATLRRVEG